MIEPKVQEKALELLKRNITEEEYTLLKILGICVRDKTQCKENYLNEEDEVILESLRDQGFLKYDNYGASIVIGKELKELIDIIIN